MIKSTRNLRPEPGEYRRQAATVAELKTYRVKSGQLRLKDADGAWWWCTDRPMLFPAIIARRERKGLRTVEAYWRPHNAKPFRPVSLADVREVYRLQS